MEEHHGAHADHAELFRRKFWLCLALTVPTVVYSDTAQRVLDYTAPQFRGHTFVAPFFGTLVFLTGGLVFLRGGVSEVRSRQPGMMLLISMGLVVAFSASIATELGWIDVDLWFELATLVTIMLLGHWLEMRAIGQAQGALAALAELLPDTAERVVDDGLEVIHIRELERGDIVLVRPGGRVPADGVIVDGAAEIDESMITGESRPVPKSTGDRVVAGTVATDSAIRVRVDALGDDTVLAGIQRLVAEAQASQSRAQALADRFAALLFYVATAAGASDVSDLGAARTPRPSGRTDRHGARDRVSTRTRVGHTAHHRGFDVGVRPRGHPGEEPPGARTHAHDRCGALRQDGHPDDRAPRGDRCRGVELDEDEVLGLAAAVEGDSEHPLARAIVAAAQQRQHSIPVASGFRALPGRGVEATVDNKRVAVGGPALLRELKLSEPAALATKTEAWRTRGAAVLHVVRDGAIVGALTLEDQIRPESIEAVNDLHAFGARVVMITGDARQVADSVGAALGVDEVFAEVLPEDKDRTVADLQARGLHVAMVGDGVNDAPALARADVGIAIGAGTDVAIESAGVVLASSDPRGVVGVIRLSRASYRKMVQNLAWGAGYNLVAIPLAAGVLEFAGVTLSPAAGAILMSASTIIVAFNAQLLRRLDLRPSDDDRRVPVPAVAK